MATENKEFCERCEKTCEEVFMCQRCESLVCDKCLTTYNQFTQIDYDCCKGCANNNDD